MALMSSMSAGSGAMSGVTFPAHPLKVGDRWEAAIDFGKLATGSTTGMSMNGKIPVKMKLISVAGGKATIGVSMVGTLNMTAPGAAGGKIQSKMDGKGTFVCNISDGTMVSTNMVTDTTTAIGANTMKQHMVQSLKRQ